MIIDSHAHIDTPEDVGTLLQQMQEANISHSLVLYVPTGVHEMSMPFETFLELLAPHPQLLPIGSIQIVDNADFDKEFDQLSELVANKTLYGIKLYLGYEHFYANDERARRVYELASQHNVPVIFHTGDTWGHPTSLVRYANPLYIDDVATQFPKLNIVIAHLGNPMWIRETAELLYKNENVYADLSGIYIDENPTDHPISKRYRDDIKKDILRLAAYVGTPRKLIFGTDFPLVSAGEYTEFIHSTFADHFSEEDFAAIFHDNAARLFHIEPKK